MFLDPLMRLITPQILDLEVAPATGTIELIAERIFRVIVLMITLLLVISNPLIAAMEVP